MDRFCALLGLDGTGTAKRAEIYRRGQVLFRQGDTFDYIYALRSGSVKTSVSGKGRRVQITGFHFAGEPLGLSAYAKKQYGCAAEALETSSVCKVDVNRVEEIARTVPSMYAEMVTMLSVRVQQDEQLIFLLGTRRAEERLADFLIGLSRRVASRAYFPTQFRLSMSRREIGSHLGMAEETICRILARLHDSGCITLTRRTVRINDMERLSAIVSSAPVD